MPLRNGETFAGFRIVCLLGSGGMGEVYLAEHPRLPRRNALKILPAEVSADDEYRTRFNREADLASTLWHPHSRRKHDGGRAALSEGEEDRLSEADGVHDGLDLGRSIIQRANFRDRVRQPDPGLVEHEDPTERGELVEESLEFGHGPDQLHVEDERRD